MVDDRWTSEERRTRWLWSKCKGFQLRVMSWFCVLERKSRVETGAMRIVLWTVPEVLRAANKDIPR
jgi:hypothetical protein